MRSNWKRHVSPLRVLVLAATLGVGLAGGGIAYASAVPHRPSRRPRQSPRTAVAGWP